MEAAKRKGGSKGEVSVASGRSKSKKQHAHVPEPQPVSRRENLAARRKGGLEGEGNMASGSIKRKKKQEPVAEANSPLISRRENRKRALEERREDDGGCGSKRDTGKETLSLSLLKEKFLADAGVGKTTTDRSEPLLESLLGDDIKDILGGKGDDDAWAAWQACFEEAPTIPNAKREESIEEWEMRMTERLKSYGDEKEYLLETDYEDHRSSVFRRHWEFLWSRDYGAFEDATRIPAMRFTFKPPDTGAMPISTLQLFSVKVAATRCGLQLPLDVFGMVAVRDRIDNNRNIIFSRTRDNCQTLTKEHPYLVLTGPTRAVLMDESVTIEVDLRVKGTTDSEDKQLSSLGVPILCSNSHYSRLWSNLHYTSKLSTVEFGIGVIAYSVEATIFVQVTRGSWPDHFSGQFSAIATGLCSKNPSNINHVVNHASVDHEEIMLLDSRGEKLPVNGDGRIELSRCVVSVDTRGELKVYAKAWGDDNSFTKEWKGFKPLEAGKSVDTIDIGFCAMDVTVFWSLISYNQVYADTVL